MDEVGKIHVKKRVKILVDNYINICGAYGTIAGIEDDKYKVVIDSGAGIPSCMMGRYVLLMPDEIEILMLSN